jgi:hypothetical protein
MENITDLLMQYDFFITKSGATYKAFNGKTGIMQFSGSEFATVVNSCINTFTYEGTIQLDRGEFDTSIAAPSIDFNGKSIHLKGRGVGISNPWVKWGTMIKAAWGQTDYVIKNSNVVDTMYSASIEDIYINGNSRHDCPGAISLTNSWFGVIRNVGITAFVRNVSVDASNATGITFSDTSGVGNGCYYNTVENVYIQNCTIGINFGLLANACTVIGGFIRGTNTANTQYGIIEDDADTITIIATDISGFVEANSIALYLKATSIWSSQIKVIAGRFEQNTKHVVIDHDGGWAKFIGCNFVGSTVHGTFTIANGGGYNYFIGCNIDVLSVVTDSCTGAAISKFVDNYGHITYNHGTTGVIADGAAVTHGLYSTVLGAVATGSVAGEFVSVTTLDTDHFHVAIKKHDGGAGTNQVVYWAAWCN